MKEKKQSVFVAGSQGYANWLQNTDITNSIENATVLMLTGGTDISPELYGQPRHKRTERADTRRDIQELDYVRRAIERKIPIIGICRGSQLLCALAGGQLIQDQPNPMYIHPIQAINPFTGNTESIDVTSSHHQAAHVVRMKDYQHKAWVLGFTPTGNKYNNAKVGQFKDGWDRNVTSGLGVEAVYYPELNAVGIQSHPEWLVQDRTTRYAKTFEYYDMWYEALVTGKLAGCFKKYLQNSGNLSEGQPVKWKLKTPDEIPQEIPEPIDPSARGNGIALTEKFLLQAIEACFGGPMPGAAPTPPAPVTADVAPTAEVFADPLPDLANYTTTTVTMPAGLYANPLTPDQAFHAMAAWNTGTGNLTAAGNTVVVGTNDPVDPWAIDQVDPEELDEMELLNEDEAEEDED